jgi:ribosomal 50S subunit-associated protein YjgA (DUF615 family)
MSTEAKVEQKLEETVKVQEKKLVEELKKKAGELTEEELDALKQAGIPVPTPGEAFNVDKKKESLMKHLQVIANVFNYLCVKYISYNVTANEMKDDMDPAMLKKLEIKSEKIKVFLDKEERDLEKLAKHLVSFEEIKSAAPQQ